MAVTPDFKGINVFWIAKGTKDDDILEALLMKNAGSLRHELSQLKVMGVVPKINFVRGINMFYGFKCLKYYFLLSFR